VHSTAEASQAQPGPTTQKERHFPIDVLRGLALLGILMANIDDFGTTEAAHQIPIGTPVPSFEGPHAWINLTVLILKWAFIEGKMRGLFSMLFGAGAVLMAERAERRGGAAGFADIYLRRNMWLLAIGFLHGFFIWTGDVLFYYALVALLALYPCRKLRARTLLIAGTLISLSFGTYAVLRINGSTTDLPLSRAVIVVKAQQASGQPVTAEQKQVLKDWDARLKKHAVSPEKTAKALAEGTQPYIDSLKEKPDFYIGAGSARLYFLSIADSLGMMLIGMGLFKLGFLSGQLSHASYARTAVIGFLLSVPLYVLGVWKSYLSGFDFVVTDWWLFVPYYFTREAGTLAIAATALLVIKSGALGGLQRALAAIGKTALSNYLMTSVVCQFIFVWSPWPLYGKLEYYQLHYVVLAIWCLNLSISPLWLRFYQFGPVEWLWRSLTYVKVQAMRRSA
jgi:uncharacterized protein